MEFLPLTYPDGSDNFWTGFFSTGCKDSNSRLERIMWRQKPHHRLCLQVLRDLHSLVSLCILLWIHKCAVNFWYQIFHMLTKTVWPWVCVSLVWRSCFHWWTKWSLQLPLKMQYLTWLWYGFYCLEDPLQLHRGTREKHEQVSLEPILVLRLPSCEGTSGPISALLRTYWFEGNQVLTWEVWRGVRLIRCCLLLGNDFFIILVHGVTSETWSSFEVDPGVGFMLVWGLSFISLMLRGFFGFLCRKD